jgi:hypothetical protein
MSTFEELINYKMSFGEIIPGKPFKVVDENVIRLNALFIFIFAGSAFITGFEFNNFQLLPYMIGVVWINFIIGLFINLNAAPSMFLSRLILGKKITKPIGAIQKKFAWGLGLTLSSIILTLTLLLPYYPGLFNTVCLLCIVCLVIIFLEAAFKVCLGCELYFFAIDIKLLKAPKPDEKPNCMGDSCEV